MPVWNKYDSYNRKTYPLEACPVWVFTFSTEHIGLARFQDRPPINTGDVDVLVQPPKFLYWGLSDTYYEYKSACDVTHWAYAVLPPEPIEDTET